MGAVIEETIYVSTLEPKTEKFKQKIEKIKQLEEKIKRHCLKKRIRIK